MNDKTASTETIKRKAPNIAPKLSISTINAQPAKGSLKPDTPPFDVGAFFGKANKYDLVTTTYGDQPRFYGDFRGMNAQTGELWQSGRLFLPGFVADVLISELDNREDTSLDVEFGVMIGVKYSEKGNTGYAFTCRSLIETASRDPLDHLTEQVKAQPVHLPQLPAPVATSAPVVETVAETEQPKTAKKK